jgi:hypothetical protein
VFGAACVTPVAWSARPVPVGNAGWAPFEVAVSGSSAVWPWTARRFASPVEIRVASAGRVPRTILRGEPTPGGGVEQLPFFAAGTRRVAASLVDFVRTEETVTVAGASAWTGSPSRALEREDAIGRHEWVGGVAVSGRRIALLAFHRTRERARPRLLLIDGRTGTRRTRRLSRHTGLLLALAGRFVALASQRGDRDLTRITVRDAGTWRVRTRAVIREDSIDVALALRPDGTLAVAYGSSRHRAGLVRPGGRLRRLPIRPSRLQIRFGPRGAVYPERVRRGTRLVEVTRAGRVRPLTAPIRGYVNFDAAHDRLALRTRRCVYVAPLPALGAARPCPFERG